MAAGTKIGLRVHEEFRQVLRNVSQGPDEQPSKNELLKKRNEFFPPAVALFYEEDPLMVCRAFGQYLYDERGSQLLDCINNVQHVGHCHPTVADAILKQSTLSTLNSRYLHNGIVELCERLSATLPPALNSFLFCNSGSEANDVALRMARDYTNGTEIIVLEHAYHGNLTSLIDISPLKFNGKGGKGAPDHVHVAPIPDAFRGKFRLATDKLHDAQALQELGKLYASEVKAVCNKIRNNGKKLCAFYMESLISCGGQVVPPASYLGSVMKHVHEAGGVVVMDEVQTGFGRVGSQFWAFQLQEGAVVVDDTAATVVPDIVTMGKPIGNGFPIGAVATKRKIAQRFGGGMEYFNTFGGNPVACAAALAVLQVMEDENLQLSAKTTGKYLHDRLCWLMTQHSNIIGDVRCVGLFAGVDLVKDPRSREPATAEAKQIVKRMREMNIIISSEGPFNNVLKMKPPLCFTTKDVDNVVDHLDQCLKELCETRGKCCNCE